MTPRQKRAGKKSAGRDHHGPANFVVFAGGGLRMGQVIGETDSDMAEFVAEKLLKSIEIRRN
jgi:hypothetical protein